MTFDLSNYVDVAERIAQFREQYPDGSLQATVLRWPDVNLGFVAVEARAYRTPADERPGYGLAWEPFPGKTPYTKDSELQNAETSAWGRALVAVLAADTKKGIASRNEVEARATSDSGATSPPRAAGAGDSKPASPPESGTTSVPTSLTQAGAAESGSGAVGGEAAASDPGLFPHEPQWIDSPTVRNMVMCAVAKCSRHPSRRKTAEVSA